MPLAIPPTLVYGTVTPDADTIRVTMATGETMTANPGPPQDGVGEFPVDFYVLEVLGGATPIEVAALGEEGNSIATVRLQGTAE